MARLNASEKRKALEEKMQQMAAQLRDLDARDKEAARKEDTRRKVVAGAIALEHLEKHAKSAWADEFRAILEKTVEPRNRHLFPFLTQPQASAGVMSETATDAAHNAAAATTGKAGRRKNAAADAAPQETAPAA